MPVPPPLNLLLIEAQDEMTSQELEYRRDALTRCIAKLRQRDRELLTRCYGETSGVHAAAKL